MSIFTGSGTALITPFHFDGSVNYDKLEELIEFQIANKTDSLVICGTTGEASTLTDNEQIECIKFAVEVVKKRVPVIAGSGSNHTDHGIYLSKKAEEVGADACLVVTPYYNKTTQKGLIEHYTLIAESIKIPIIMYNVPSRTGLNMVPKTVYELSKVPNILAVKEASGNISQVAEIAAMCGDNMDIYSGNDDQIVPLLSLGAKGVISVVSNILPKDTHDIVELYLTGEVKKSCDLQLKMLRVINALFCEVNPIPVKEALNLMGYHVGPCRRPLTSMEVANLNTLVKALNKYGITTKEN